MSKNTSPIGGYYPTTSNTSSSSSGTSSGSATQSPTPTAAGIYTTALQNALSAAATPFQPYQGQLVAGFTPAQLAAQKGFENSVGMSKPYYTAAQDLYNQGLKYMENPQLRTASNYYTQGIDSAYNSMTPLAQSYYTQSINAANPENYNVERYMNPYQQAVVDATMNQLAETQKRAEAQNTQQSVLRGTYGGSGQFLGRAEIARQQGLANAQTLAQLNAQNYINAQNQYNTQLQNQMQAYQAAAQQLGALGYQNAALKSQSLQNAAQGLGSLGATQQAQNISNLQNLAAGMSNLGTQAQQSYMQSLAGLAQSGAQQQQLQQQQLNTAYQQWLQAKAYPYQQASYLSGLASGVGPLLGATTTQNASQSSSGTGSQLGMQPYQNQSGGGGLGGILTTGLGLLGGFMGFKDGGRVTDRKHYASGGYAEDDSDEMDFGSAASRSSPYASVSTGRSDLGSLVGQQPYASRDGNYVTESLKLAKIIPSAQQVASANLQKKIAEALSGIPQHGEVAPVSREITSSFFGAQEPSSSGFGGQEYSRSSSSKRDSQESESTDEEDKNEKNEKNGFGSLLSGVTDSFSSLFNSEPGGFLASGGRVYRDAGGTTTASTGNAPTGAAPTGIAPQEAATFIKNLYQSQLGRPADQGGFNYWTNQLQTGANTKEDAIRLFASSPEGKSKVENLYQTLFNRDADPGGRQYWQNRLGSDLTLEEVRNSMRAASETASANNAQNQITNLFQGALGRDPNAAELRQWTMSLNAGTPLSDVSKYLASTSRAQQRLADIYQQNLGQDIDVPTRDKWTALMAQGTPLNTIEDYVKSTPEARQYDLTHPGIVGSAAVRSPKTIGDLMETPESIAFNRLMDPTGKSAAGFADLMADVYASGPGPQFSPEQQGMPAMPDQSYYTRPSPSYLPQSQLVSYPAPTSTGSSSGTTTTPPAGYLGISQTATGLSPAAFVTNLYQRYTGTAPTEDQLARAVSAINSGTSLQTIETDLAKTTPAQNQAFITQLYNKVYGRAPDSEDVQYWTNQLAQGVPANEIVRLFATSPERGESSVVQGYFPTISPGSGINPFTGLANLTYVAPYRSQPVPFMSSYKDGGRVGRARGGRLSTQDIAKAALQAGASPKEAAILTSIAHPESGGNPYAHNPNARTGDNSYGLWQINMLGGMGPERRRQFGLSRNEDLFDPVTNAKAALSLLRSGGGLKNWTTFTHGKHSPYYSAAVDAVNNLQSDPKAMLTKIEMPAPLSLPTRGGEPNRGSIMFGNAPASQVAEKSSEPKSLKLSELIQNIIAPALTGEQSEQPKLATAPTAPIIPLAPMPAPVIAMDNLGEDERGSYLDRAIAMNQRANGGRLHFQDGGTDDESRDRFYREQLEGSAPQYDPEAGWETADRAGEIGLNLASLLPAGKAIANLQRAYKTGKGVINAIRSMRGLGSGESAGTEPGLGALEYQPRAPRGRQPSPAGEPIPMGIKTKPGMNRFESNTEGMRRNIPGNEIFQWSSLREPAGSRPMSKFEQGQTGLAWNRFGAYEPNKAPAYFDKYGNVSAPLVKYDGVSQRPIPPLMANQNYYPGRIPGNDLRAGSAGRGPAAGRGFFNGKPEFTPAELGQELATQGGRGMSVPPSRLPATRSNIPTLASGARGGGNGEPPIYADYRDVTGNILGGPKGGPLATQPGFRGPNNKIAKTVAAINGGPTIPPAMSDLPPFNPNITSNMPTPKLTDYYRVDRPVSAEDKPSAKRAAPRAKRVAPQDDRRYWGDWRDTAGFEEDPIGNFLDTLTGDRRVARKPGTIKSPMSPYAGEGSIHFAHGGRAYREEGGLLDSLSSAFKSYKPGPISQGLVAAGLGMMASPQHDPLRAIGEGGLRGIQVYDVARQREKEEQKRLEEQKSDTDFAQRILENLKEPQKSPSLTPLVRKRGGAARHGYADGGQPQQEEGFDPFEAIGAVGDAIGSGLQSLGDTIGGALMPAAQAEEAAPSSRPRRGPGPISQGLISAGLGMMASPAHNPLRAIGEGGLRGVQAYNTAADEQRKEDLIDAERRQNESFAKSLTEKLPTAAPTVEAPTLGKTAESETPVVAKDRPAENSMDTARRQLEYLSSVIPKNSTQEKILTRLINQKKYELSGNVGILGTDEFGIPKRGYISGPRAGTYLDANQPGATPAVPKDLHGEGFLELLPSTEFANTVKSVAQGRSKMPTGPRGAKVRAAVLQYDPDYREARYDVIQSAGKTSGNNLGATINSGNTAIKHLGEASDAIKDLAKTEFAGGKYPMVNWLEQKIKPGLFGYEELKRLETAKERFAEEATKFYRGVGGAEADVKRSMDRLNAAQTPAELNAILDEEMSLFSGKVLGVKSVYDNAFKSGHVKYDEFEPITDESKNYMEIIKGRSPKKYTHTMEDKKKDAAPSAPSSQTYVEGQVYPRGGRSFMYKNGRFVEVEK